MIAIPVKSPAENSPMATHFGKCQFMALIDQNEIKIMSNPHTSGRHLADWMRVRKVQKLIVSELGTKAYSHLQKAGVEVHFYPKSDVPFTEIADMIKQGNTIPITEENADDYLTQKGTSSHHDQRHDSCHEKDDQKQKCCESPQASVNKQKGRRCCGRTL